MTESACAVGSLVDHATRPSTAGVRRVSGEADFTEFYSATFAPLTAQLHAFIGDHADAQDLVQEAYLRAYSRWSTVSKYDDPLAWVHRVAWNLAISRWRRKK